PAAERQKLVEHVRRAHEHGRKVRFWATPEKEAVWNELLAAGADYINTDKLDELQKFLLAKRRQWTSHSQKRRLSRRCLSAMTGKSHWQRATRRPKAASRKRLFAIIGPQRGRA